MESILAALLEHIVPIIISLLGAVIVAVVRGLAKKYGENIDLKTKALTEDLVNHLVTQGIMLAEQWAKVRAKRLNEKVGGNDKLQIAMKFIADELRKKGITDMAEKEIRNRIEAMLGIQTVSTQALGIPSQLLEGLEQLPEDTDEDNPGI